MSGMNISSVGPGTYYPDQPQNTPRQTVDPVQEEQETLVDALKEQEEDQKTLVEMMKEAREKAEEASKKRDEMLKQTKSRRYGDAAILAYSKLARARSVGEVDAASGYARRQIAQLRAAKRSNSDDADRIQAAIDQLQKAVNRAGRKKREISQETLTAKRQARLEKEERSREAKRLRQELKRRKAQRMLRESGYLREAEVDDKVQSQLSAAKLELREQMQEVSAAVRPQMEAAVQQYTAAAAEPAPAPEISVEA